MILIISENNQVIGADEEFLNNNSLDNLKEEFNDSLPMYTLQNEIRNSFEFQYNNTTFTIHKYPIFIESQKANLYIFENDNNDNEDIIISNESTSDIDNLNLINETNQNNTNKENSNEDNSQLTLELPKDEEKPSLDLSLDLNENESQNNLELEKDEEKPSFDLSLDLNENESQNNLELPKNEEKPSLDLSLDLNENEPQINLELSEKDEEKSSLDLSLDLNEDEPQNNLELQKDEEKSSLDLGLDLNEDESQINLELPKDKEKSSLDLGLDLNENESQNNLELEKSIKSPQLDISNNQTTTSISEEEIANDLTQASNDLGIDNNTIKEFFKDFKQQLKDEKEIFFEALNNQDYETLHKSSHKLKGVALNLRLNKFAELLKTADELAKNHSDITKIKNILENIYEVIDNSNQNTKLSIDIDIPQDEKIILFKSLYQLLEDIKTKDISTIKKELNNAYNLIPVKELLEINNIEDDKIIDFINNLNKKLKKEIK